MTSDVIEEWQEVKGYNGRYLVSNLGNIRSTIGTDKPLTPYKNNKGYYIVKLSEKPTEKGKYKTKDYLLHRLIAETFIDSFKKDMEVHHKNLDRADNRLENLLPLSKQEHRQLHNKLREQAKQQDNTENPAAFNLQNKGV